MKNANTTNITNTGIANNKAPALPLRSLSPLKTAKANHVPNASKSNCTIEIFNGQTLMDIPDNIHFFIFFGNVTFIIILFGYKSYTDKYKQNFSFCKL